MQITSFQQFVFNENAKALFVGQMIAFLQEQFPAAAAERQEDLLPVVELLLEKACGYGFEDEDQFGSYVVTAWLIGADFDSRFPAAQRVLNLKDLAAEQKAQWLEQWTLGMLESLAPANEQTHRKQG